MTSAQGGFAGAKQALSAVSGQTQWINSQVSSGKLALDPDVAEKAAKRCEDEISELQKIAAHARQITRVEGLGNYPDGNQLARRFEDKATMEGSGALPLLRELQDELRKQADAFRAAAKDYRTIDEQNADDLRRGMK